MMFHATTRARDLQRGATAVEYALLVALIAGVLVAVILLLGDNVFGLLQLANDSSW